MKNETFIKKLKKRIPSIQIYAEQGHYHAVHEGTLLTWRTSPKWDDDKVIEASGFHTKGVDQESDPYTDYYPGTFWHNGTQAIDRLSPPPNKFKVGQLVRGKDNKRANRYGYAGELAIVTKAPAGDFVRLQFNDLKQRTYNDNYHSRDFDLVSG